MADFKRVWNTLTTTSKWPVTDLTPSKEKEDARLKKLCSIVPDHPAGGKLGASGHKDHL